MEEPWHRHFAFPDNLARHHLKGLYVVALGKVRSFLVSRNSGDDLGWYHRSWIQMRSSFFLKGTFEKFESLQRLCVFIGSLKGFKKHIFQIALLFQDQKKLGNFTQKSVIVA